MRLRMLGLGMLLVALPLLADEKETLDRARMKSARKSVGSLRAAIAIFYAWKATPDGGGEAVWPTLDQLGDGHTVLKGDLPDNPYDATPPVNNVVDASGVKRGTLVLPGGGWAYDPKTGVIWLNTATEGVNENAF